MNYFLSLVFFAIPLAWSTRVNANYVTTKTLMVYLFSAIALFVINDKLSLKKIPKNILIIGASLVAYQIAYYAFDYSYHNILYAFKILSFWFLVLYFYSLNLSVEEFLRKNYFLIASVFGLIVAITCGEMLKQFQATSFVSYGVVSTFGNVNMFAEFLVLGLPLLFFWSRYESKIFEAIRLLILCCVVYFILFANSRSAWLGLILWFAAKVYLRLSKKEILTLVSALVLFLGTKFLLIDSKTLDIKDQNVAVRSELYKSAVDIMVSNPTGIEIGRYLSDMVPFYHERYPGMSEYSYFDQPHSDILKWGVQFGVVYFALSLLFLVFLLWNSGLRFVNVKKQKANESDSLFFEVLLVLFPQMAFQFPFENPASLLILAFYLGLYLSSFVEIKVLDISKYKIILAALGVAGVINAFLFISSVYLESTQPRSTDIMKFACEFYPINFKTCYWKQINYLESKNYKSFSEEYKRDMTSYPFYIDYLRVLPTYYSSIGDEKKMCESMQIYTYLYEKQRSFPEDVIKFCSGKPKPFDFKDTANFKINYMAWLHR